MTIVVSNTLEKLVVLAYRDAGLTQEGESPNPAQTEEAIARVNDMVNLWQTQGLKLFLLRDTEVPLTAGKATYTFYPSGDVKMVKPLRVLQAYYIDPCKIRRPLVVLAWEEWLRLSQIHQTGQINSYFVDKQYDRLNVWFWLVPDACAAKGFAHLLLEVQADNYTALTNTVTFPPEWFLALRWGLADELATGQSSAIMARCESRATAYRKALEDWDVEDAPTSFVPDQRGLSQNPWGRRA